MNFWLSAIIWLAATLPPWQAGDLAPGYWERTPLPEIGLATYYAAGTMDWVWNYRSQHAEVPECPECVGAVALLRAGDIGRKVWLQPPGGELAGPFLVVDCAHTDDIPALLARTWSVDVSYELGQLWGMSRPLDGVIVWPDPAETDAPRVGPRPSYIDPREVVISVPTLTPEPTPQSGMATATPDPAAWPTRQPLPLANPSGGLPIITMPTPLVTSSPAPSAEGPAVPAVNLASPAPTDSRAAPAGLDAGGAPTAQPITPDARALATALPGSVALGRPGLELLMTAPSISSAPAMPTQSGTARRPVARPTSPPILLSPPAPLSPESSQEEVSAFARLWQALLGLLGTAPGQ